MEKTYSVQYRQEKGKQALRMSNFTMLHKTKGVLYVHDNKVVLSL